MAQLSAADRDTSLEPEDLVRLATVTYLVGRDDDSAGLWERAHDGFLSRDEEEPPRCAFWLGIGLLDRGELARGGGWLARARGLVDDGFRECVERGYVLVPDVLQCLGRRRRRDGLRPRQPRQPTSMVALPSTRISWDLPEISRGAF